MKTDTHYAADSMLDAEDTPVDKTYKVSIFMLIT